MATTGGFASGTTLDAYALRCGFVQEVVTLSEEGHIETSTYADLHRRSQLCAIALQKLGVK